MSDKVPVHRVFRERARERPQAAAVVFEGRTTSYGELERRASALSAELLRRGLRPEARVGLLAERSPEVVAGALGVLGARAAYVPLDPAHPLERLAGMADDSGAKLLLAPERLLPRARELGRPVLALEEALAGAGGDDLPDPHPDGLAYVVFTSGSTGRPKGVAVTHRGLANHRAAVAREYALVPEDRVLQFASPSFDVFAEEVYPTLGAGAALVVRDERALASFKAFHDFLARAGVTVLNLPAAYWHEWVEDLERGGEPPPECVRLVIAGSERARPDRYREWRRRVPLRVAWRNGYGPTETTVTATVYEPAPHDDLEGLESVPIGAPVDGMRARVLRADLSEAEDGEPGELALAGPGVARGYAGRPGATAERFVPDPWAPAPGERMYLTGDRARRRPDGSLEFLGRVDSQVKLRGHRIELDEIEAALARHGEVASCAVVLREDRPGFPALCAYCVPRGAAPGSAELRAFLARSLPEYMLPSAFVALERLPLLPSGKVDRRALPAPERSRPDLGVEFVAPAGELQEEIARQFEELLGIEPVGARDDFFLLGGHSLVATRLAARLSERFDVPVSLLDVFAQRTVQGLAELVSAGGSAAPELPPVRRVPRGGVLEVSYAQEPLWFLLQLEPDNLAYNTQLSIHLRGELDHAVLQRAFTEIVRRHEVLRTTFHELDGRPVQEIHEPFAVEIPLHDLTGLEREEARARARRIAAEVVRRPFDVTRLPLAHWELVRVAPDEHVLVQTEHHFVHDGASIALLMGEMKALYEAFRAGRPSPLPELAVQFADFAAWQRELLSGERLRGLLEHWTAALAGAPPLLELPTDRPRPRLQTFRGGTYVQRLRPELYHAVQDLSRRLGTTHFMTMLAAFKVMLSRHSGQTDLVVATTVANRRRKELEPMIGMVVNPIVLRTRLDGDPTFREAAGRVRESALDAYAHQDVPFERIVEAVAPRRDFSHNPIFQVMFSFHDNPVPDLAFEDGLVGEVEYTHNGSAKFDLNLIVIPRSEQRVGRARSAEDESDVIVEWEYNADLFDEETVRRFARHFRHLVESAVSDPDRSVSSLPMLGGDERRALLSRYSRTGDAFPADACVHYLVARTCARAPERTAVAVAGAPDAALTYRDLEERSARLAGALRARGVRRGDRVALCLRPSPELLLGQLAVMRAGAAWVPLDPDHPPARRALVLEDSRPRLLVTRRELSDGAGGTELLLLDEEEAALRAAEPLRGSPAGPEDAAYVLYTSGSTGKPKGVQVPHRAVVNFLASMAERPGLGEDDALLAVTTFAFDIAVLESFLPLCVGARVVLAPREVTSDGARLARAVEETGTTALQATPATWRMLVDAGLAKRPLQALCGGEALPPELAREVLERTGTLWNMYGPTETTIWSAVARIEDERIALGEPIGNTSLYVLDEHGEPAPVGVAGELFIGGAGVAHGYLGRPALTAERFVPDPWAERPGARMYRTGDRVRRTSAGALEFLGRTDHQVKVRGFRIELGEVEACLAEVPGVAECAVAARGRGADVALVGYWARSAEDGVAAGALRERLAERLPAYMIPSVFVELPALPRTPNGKLDRAALPAPPRPERSADAPQPRTETERTLARIWADVLELDTVSPTDNFFDLGGHSLLSIRAIARIEEALGVRLSPRQLMLQTLVQVAAACDERIASGDGPPAAGPQGEGGIARRLLSSLRSWVAPRDR